VLKKVYIYIASSIYKITNFLKINRYYIERIWIVMKYILCVKFETLVNNFLDAVILSTIYVVLKKANEEIAFNTIIQK
jgi:hypothetical protein